MRVFITGWLNSQYLPGIKRYASRTAIYFPLVATRVRACSSTVSPCNSEFFDILKKRYHTRKGRGFYYSISCVDRADNQINNNVSFGLLRLPLSWPLRSHVLGDFARIMVEYIRIHTLLSTYLSTAHNFVFVARGISVPRIEILSRYYLFKMSVIFAYLAL